VSEWICESGVLGARRRFGRRLWRRAGRLLMTREWRAGCLGRSGEAGIFAFFWVSISMGLDLAPRLNVDDRFSLPPCSLR
jgi:hypothetical protein